jgi:hypothetical protein
MIIHNVEQNSDEWYALRAGIPTSSNGSMLVTSTGKASASIDDFAIMLANDLYAGKPLDAWTGNKHTDRGHELEPIAVSYFEMMHDDYVVVDGGFITTDDGLSGSSPDRLVNDDTILEVKCLSAKEHTKELMFYKRNEKLSSKYHVQKQDQMLVCERAINISLFYHPVLPPFEVIDTVDDVIVEMLIKQKAEVIKKRDAILKILNES